VVSHDFAFERWPQGQVVQFDSEEKQRRLGFGITQLFLYRVPSRN
jgi:hypothetical protein